MFQEKLPFHSLFLMIFTKALVHWHSVVSLVVKDIYRQACKSENKSELNHPFSF